MRKPYARPAITAEDEMEQTALQTCYVTELYDGANGSGNFVVDCSTENVEKGGTFDGILGCDTIYTGQKFDAPPLS